MLISFLEWTLKCTETLVLFYLVCLWKKTPSKVGYFIKIAEIFSIALTAHSAPQNNYQIFLSFYSTILRIFNFEKQCQLDEICMILLLRLLSCDIINISSMQLWKIIFGPTELSFFKENQSLSYKILKYAFFYET